MGEKKYRERKKGRGKKKKGLELFQLYSGGVEG